MAPAPRLLALAIGILGVSALAACTADLAPLALAAEPLRRPLVRHRRLSFGSYFDISFQTGNKLTDVYTVHPRIFDAGYSPASR
jgi:hypothetical protein